MLRVETLTAADVMAVVMLVEEAQTALAGIATVIAAYDAQLEVAEYPLRFEDTWPDGCSVSSLLVERERWQIVRDAMYRRYARRLDMSLAVARLAARRSYVEVMSQLRKGGKR